MGLCILCTTVASCDANKAKVSDLAKQFVQAVNDNDKVAMYDLYPMSRKFSVVQLSEIESSSVKINYDKTDSVYIASLNDRQKLVIKLTDDGEPSIVDSYNVFKLDADAYSLAAMTGVPVKTLSDKNNEKMFKEDEIFMRSLIEMCPRAVQGNLGVHDMRHDWERGRYAYLRYQIPATNYGKTGVRGEDYMVEFTFIHPKTREVVGSHVEEGVDISAGGTYVFEFYKNELYGYEVDTGYSLNIDVYFRFKNIPAYAMLVKYGTFTGNEYSYYVEEMNNAGLNAHE